MMAMDKELAQSPLMEGGALRRLKWAGRSSPLQNHRSAQLLAVGSLMPPGAQPCSHENSDIFARIPSTLSTRSGQGSAALRNGTATNGANVFPITRTSVAPRV